ncbi:unnamed protein product [Effrenium voratum]|nr:unnamed protein product [Effrenium voratum]CAJ1459916.1 unnamed protein product [Effrenium voratum]
MFGSFSNGFKTGTSDLDVLLAGNVHNESAISILQRFAANLESMDLGFTNITKIFQASVPLLKLTDKDSEMEVDFCVGNELGLRNSFLLNTYCKYDMRALELGRLVKEWAKKHELVGTTDGCLNSYAYMLLVVFYLQSLQPPVVPNLQLMECESYLVNDRKWGGEDMWETKFFTDVDSLPKSQNTMTIGELLPGFFHFYTRDFDWRHHAVCIRKQEPGKHVDKYSLLLLPTNEDQWYVEDPFDLKHNLAGKCSRAGKKRIMDEMANALSVLQKQGVWSKCLPAKPSSDFYMKCRISQSVTPPDILEAFEEFDLVKLHFPKSETSRMPQAFLQFGDASSRRRAHTKNETYIVDCKVQLHYSSFHGLAEALTQCPFSTYEMASYKMQRQVLEARVGKLQGTMGGPGFMPFENKVDPMRFQMPPPVDVRPPAHPFWAPPAPPARPPGLPAAAPAAPIPGRIPPPAPAVPPQVRGKNEKEEHRREIKNKPLAAARPKAPREATGQAWLYVELTDNFPKDKPKFSPEDAQNLKKLHAHFQQFSSSESKPPAEKTIYLSVPLTVDAKSGSGDPILDDETQQKLREILQGFPSPVSVT